MLARTDQGKLFAWGINKSDSNVDQTEDRLLIPHIYKPQEIDYFRDKNIVEISCAHYNCLALSNSGVVYEWHNNYLGQTQFEPKVLISIKQKAKSIYAFEDRSFAITFDGLLYGWGCNKKGNIGINKQDIIQTPQMID